MCKNRAEGGWASFPMNIRDKTLSGLLNIQDLHSIILISFEIPHLMEYTREQIPHLIQGRHNSFLNIHIFQLFPVVYGLRCVRDHQYDDEFFKSA